LRHFFDDRAAHLQRHAQYRPAKHGGRSQRTILDDVIVESIAMGAVGWVSDMSCAA
jgi:hypothetical protein